MMKVSADGNSVRVSRWPLTVRLWVVIAAVLVLAVPLLYLAFLVGTGWVLVLGAVAAFERWALESGWGWANLATSAGLVAGLAAWVYFFRPFWLRPSRTGSALQVLPADQPEWFEAVAMAAVQARAPLPAEVRFDSSGEVRLDACGGLGAVVGGRHRLTVGTAWVGACMEGQLIADLTACLSSSPRGLAGRCYWFLRGMTAWLERAAVTPGRGAVSAVDVEVVAGMAFPKRQKQGWRQRPFLVKSRALFLWLTGRPVWFLSVLARVLTCPALRRVRLAGDAAAAQLLGTAGYAELLRRKAAMLAAEERVSRRLEEGIRDGRLPDNLAQLRLRELESGLALADVTMLADGAARLQRVLKRAGEPLIASGGPASSLIRRFQEIARQTSQMFYQQDLELVLSQFRLVAAGETVKKTAESEAASRDIQRYFEGLAHPLRPLCGREAEDHGRPSEEEMKRQIETSRRQMQARGDQVRSVQREWGMAWQRCRDLEMAHAMALAGMPLDARQYGLSAHDPRLYREEIARQEIIMEHSDEALRSIEVDFERRLAAALGLLMQAEPAGLDEALRAAREELPLWGLTYALTCSRLPLLWRLMNRVFAFEALGAEADDGSFKHAESDAESHAARQALDFLLPAIHQERRQLLAGLETAVCPLQREVSVHAWLTTGLSAVLVEGSLKAVAEGKAAVVVAERLMKLHQTVFAWLCRTAEAAEEALLAGASGAGEARRLPELRLGCDLPGMADIQGCVPAAAS